MPPSPFLRRATGEESTKHGRGRKHGRGETGARIATLPAVAATPQVHDAGMEHMAAGETEVDGGNRGAARVLGAVVVEGLHRTARGQTGRTGENCRPAKKTLDECDDGVRNVVVVQAAGRHANASSEEQA